MLHEIITFHEKCMTLENFELYGVRNNGPTAYFVPVKRSRENCAQHHT